MGVALMARWGDEPRLQNTADDINQALLKERVKDAAGLRERQAIRKLSKERRMADIRGQIAHLNLQLEAKWRELQQMGDDE